MYIYNLFPRNIFKAVTIDLQLFESFHHKETIDKRFVIFV